MNVEGRIWLLLLFVIVPCQNLAYITNSLQSPPLIITTRTPLAIDIGLLLSRLHAVGVRSGDFPALNTGCGLNTVPAHWQWPKLCNIPQCGACRSSYP